MPGDSFTFAVRVGCQKDLVGSGGGGTQFFKHRTAAGSIHIGGLEAVFDIDAQGVFRQVAHMTHGGDNVIILAQHTTDGAGFGGRFHDQQF